MSDSGDEQVPSTPELCMQTVEDYALDKFSKVEAVRAIFSAFYESAQYENTPRNELDAAIGMYIAMFDQHDASRHISAHRGARYTRASVESEHEEEDLLERLQPGGQETNPLLDRGPQRSEPLMNCCLPGLWMGLLKRFSSPQGKNL